MERRAVPGRNAFFHILARDSRSPFDCRRRTRWRRGLRTWNRCGSTRRGSAIRAPRSCEERNHDCDYEREKRCAATLRSPSYMAAKISGQGRVPHAISSVTCFDSFFCIIGTLVHSRKEAFCLSRLVFAGNWIGSGKSLAAFSAATKKTRGRNFVLHVEPLSALTRRAATSAARA